MTTFGITGYGAYIPRLRMQRSAIAAAHAWMAPSLKGLAKGRRAFCSWDEDAITMAVEAARDALGTSDRASIKDVRLASTNAPYADLQNATVVAGALGLGSDTATLDISGSQRAGVGALLSALKSGAAQSDMLCLASDNPRGKPASTQEMTYGAGAAAFRLGTGRPVAVLAGSASRQALFVDHFRTAEGEYDYFWEERWVRDEGYSKLVPPTVRDALAAAGIAADSVDHFILASPYRNTAGNMAKAVGVRAEAVRDDLDADCGYAGTAHGALLLASTLATAKPGESIVVVAFGQGVDAMVLRVTDAIGDFRPVRGVAGALAEGQSHDAYLRMLSYSSQINLEWGMRAEKVVKTALTDQYRSQDQLAAFVAGKCACCGTVQFPQLPTCVNPGCGAARSQFEATPLADVPAAMLTYTGDWLSYHPAPPLWCGFVQFVNGARLMMEVVEVGDAGLDVGTPLRMVFRRKDNDKDRGYARYFWKATPVQA